MRWPLSAFIVAASSSTQNIIMADDESTQTVESKGGESFKRSNTETGSIRSQKRTAPKSDDNPVDIASQSFASRISELTKSIEDSHLAWISRTEALEKQEKHKSVVRNNKREAQASCSFAQFSEEEQVSSLFSWCFEPSQPHRITSGLNTNFNLSQSY